MDSKYPLEKHHFLHNMNSQTKPFPFLSDKIYH